MPEQEPLNSSSSPISTASMPLWRRLCCWFRHRLSFIWGTLITGIIVSTLANLNTAATTNLVETFSRLFLVRLASTFPVPVLSSLGFLLLLTLLSLIGCRPGETTNEHHIDEQQRIHILGRLRSHYEQMSKQLLQEEDRVQLRLMSMPSAVQSAAIRAFRLPEQPEQFLPTDTSILQAYQQADRELLILGEPGAGKSTLLLELARDLVGQAQQETTQPLPILLPLSSWATNCPPLQDWLVQQVVLLYDVPERLCQRLVQTRQLIPLLDGFDEMEESARAACIGTINTYHREYLNPLVICSRTNEYQTAATSNEHLRLHAAIEVQPLSFPQVDSYLAARGKSLETLRTTLQNNDQLAALATTPLILSILIQTYLDMPIQALSQRERQLQEQIWADYIQQMIRRRGDERRYPRSITVNWLGWLARQMREHNLTIFYLEHLQPDWLSTNQQRTYALLAVRLPALLIGILITMLVHLFFSSATPDWSSFLQYGVLGGLLGELSQESAGTQVLQGTHRPAWKKRLALSACVGILYGGSFALYLLNPSYYTLHQWFIDGLSSSVGIGLGSFVLYALLRRPVHHRKPSQDSIPPWWSRAIRFFQTLQGPRALLVTVVIGLSILLGNELSHVFSYGLNDVLSVVLNYGLPVVFSSGVSIVLNYGLSYGLSYGLVCLILGSQTGGIHLTERLKWTGKSLRSSLFNPRHLGITVLLLCTIPIFLFLSAILSYGSNYNLFDGYSNGLIFGLSLGISLGLSYWFFFGLFHGVAQEQIEDEDRRKVNQGIFDSWQKSWVMGLFGGGMIGILGLLSSILSYGLSYLFSWGLSWSQFGALGNELHNGLTNGWFNALVMGISGMLLICLLTGGLAVLRHNIIRLLLRHFHTFPRRAQTFLDDATDRSLLQRVGGGYSFIHRLLLDHCANSETEKGKQKS